MANMLVNGESFVKMAITYGGKTDALSKMHLVANTVDRQDVTATVMHVGITAENWEQQNLADPYFANACKCLQGQTNVFLSPKEA